MSTAEVVTAPPGGDCRLTDLARAAARDLAGDAVVVTTRNPGGECRIAVVEGIGAPLADSLLGAFMAVERLLRGRPILRLAPPASPGSAVVEELAGAGIRSVMTARIDNGNARVGALHVLRYQPGLLENDALLLAYANHFRVAIAGIRTRRRPAPPPPVIEALSDLPRTAHSFRELVQGLDTTFAGVFGSGMCGVMLADSGQGVLQMVAGSFGADESTAASYRVKVSNSRSNAARVFATGDPYFSNQAAGDPAILQDYAQAFGIERLLSVALVVDGRRLGVLHHANMASNYSVADLWRVEALIPHIARAVEDAHRFLVLERQLRLERILSDTALRITNAQSVRETMSDALDALCTAMDASLIALVPTAAAPILWPAAPVSPAMEKQLLAQASERPDRRSYITGPQHAGGPGSATLHIPVGIGVQQVGMLSILRSRAEPFTAPERDALTRMAHIAALAWAADGYQRQLAEHARVKERQRIADELHEEVAQILFAAQMALDSTLESAELRSEAANDITRARALVIMADQSLRTAIQQLSRPQRGTLVSELESMVGEIEENFGLPIRLDVAITAAEACTKLRRPTRDALLTVIREALVNAAKHAGPCRASVRLAVSRRCRLTASVVDDGIGISRDGTPPGHGLACLRRVVRAQGGSLQIRSSPATGTKVLVTFAA